MTTVDVFENGIVNDPYNPSNGVCRMCTGFDIFTSPNRLIPYRDSEDGFSGASTGLMQAFVIALGASSTYKLFGLARQDAANRVRIFTKELTTGASTDLDDNGWNETANNTEATQTTPSYNLFIYYPKTGYIYGAHAGRYIFRYDPDGTDALAGTHADLTAFTNIAQGVVHSKDDVLYVPYDNKIAKNDNGTWTVAALTLPSQFYITSICEFSNYLAIAVAPLSGAGNSRVFLWDRNSALTTITENIDWGYGILKIIEELDGFLVGISLFGNSTITHKNKIFFKYYTGASPVTAIELVQDYTTGFTTNLPITKQKINNRVHFLMDFGLNGAQREGVWSFGRNSSGRFSLAHERTSNNNTALGTGTLRGFFYVGDYLFIAYNSSGGTYAVSKTNDAVSFTATSIYESVINPGMARGDKIKKKQLSSIAIKYTTLSAVSGQIVVKFKVDGGSYTTILTATTTGTNVVEQIIDSSTGLPTTSGRNFEFRLESTLGCEIISLSYDYEILETLV